MRYLWRLVVIRQPWHNQDDDSTACLAYYQNKIEKLEKFASTLEFSRISTSWELNKFNGLHFHVFFDNNERVSCPTTDFAFLGIIPRFDACTARGRSQSGALDRGHYYTQCSKKIGRLVGSTNHPVNPKAQWLCNFVIKGDLQPSDSIKLGKNRCATHLISSMSCNPKFKMPNAPPTYKLC